MHFPWDKDVDFTFWTTEVAAVPQDAVGCGWVARHAQVEVAWTCADEEFFDFVGGGLEWYWLMWLSGLRVVSPM